MSVQIASVPAKYAAFFRDVVRGAMLSVENDAVPAFAVDEKKEGEMFVVFVFVPPTGSRDSFAEVLKASG